MSSRPFPVRPVNRYVLTLNHFLSLSLFPFNDQLTEGYNQLRRRFGADSFLVNGPYQKFLAAVTPKDYKGGDPFLNIGGKIIDEAGTFFGLNNNGPGDPNGPQIGAVVSADAAVGVAPPDYNTDLLRRATAAPVSPFDNLVGVLDASGGGAGGMGMMPNPIGPSGPGGPHMGMGYYPYSGTCRLD